MPELGGVGRNVGNARKKTFLFFGTHPSHSCKNQSNPSSFCGNFAEADRSDDRSAQVSEGDSKSESQVASNLDNGHHRGSWRS